MLIITSNQKKALVNMISVTAFSTIYAPKIP